MRTLKKRFLLCCVLAGLLGGCIPDSLDDCPPKPDKEGNNVDNGRYGYECGHGRAGNGDAVTVTGKRTNT